MKDSPILEQLRELRDANAERFEFRPSEIIADARKRECQLAARKGCDVSDLSVLDRTDVEVRSDVERPRFWERSDEPLFDPIVAEVRAVRELIAAKHNYDVKAIFEDARQWQQTSDTKNVSYVSEGKMVDQQAVREKPAD